MSIHLHPSASPKSVKDPDIGFYAATPMDCNQSKTRMPPLGYSPGEPAFVATSEFLLEMQTHANNPTNSPTTTPTALPDLGNISGELEEPATVIQQQQQQQQQLELDLFELLDTHTKSSSVSGDDEALVVKVKRDNSRSTTRSSRGVVNQDGAVRRSARSKGCTTAGKSTFLFHATSSSSSASASSTPSFTPSSTSSSPLLLVPRPPPLAVDGKELPNKKTWKCDCAFLVNSITSRERAQLIKAGVPPPALGVDPTSLSKAQEKALRGAVRKIRNVASAQKSRRNQKDYIVTLETEARASQHAIQSLENKVGTLEESNLSLLSQLRRLKTLIGGAVGGGNGRGGGGTALPMIVLCGIAWFDISNIANYGTAWFDISNYQPNLIYKCLFGGGDAAVTPSYGDVYFAGDNVSGGDAVGAGGAWGGDGFAPAGLQSRTLRSFGIIGTADDGNGDGDEATAMVYDSDFVQREWPTLLFTGVLWWVTSVSMIIKVTKDRKPGQGAYVLPMFVLFTGLVKTLIYFAVCFKNRDVLSKIITDNYFSAR